MEIEQRIVFSCQKNITEHKKGKETCKYSLKTLQLVFG